jgi:hypothetical protein
MASVQVSKENFHGVKKIVSRQLPFFVAESIGTTHSLDTHAKSVLCG